MVCIIVMCQVAICCGSLLSWECRFGFWEVGLQFFKGRMNIRRWRSELIKRINACRAARCLQAYFLNFSNFRILHGRDLMLHLDCRITNGLLLSINKEHNKSNGWEDSAMILGDWKGERDWMSEETEVNFMPAWFSDVICEEWRMIGVYEVVKIRNGKI